MAGNSFVARKNDSLSPRFVATRWNMAKGCVEDGGESEFVAVGLLS